MFSPSHRLQVFTFYWCLSLVHPVVLCLSVVLVPALFPESSLVADSPDLTDFWDFKCYHPQGQAWGSLSSYLVPVCPMSLELSPFSDQPVLRLCALPYCVDCLPASSFCVPIVLNKFYSPCSFCIWVLPWQTLTEHLRKILHNFRVVQCVFLGNCHYSACPKPFPVFLSWVSAVTELVYGCQKPWLLPWQFHTAILCAGRLRLLQHRHENRSENGERCRRNLLNVKQPLHCLSFIRPEEHSGSTLYLHSQSFSILKQKERKVFISFVWQAIYDLKSSFAPILLFVGSWQITYQVTFFFYLNILGSVIQLFWCFTDLEIDVIC